jgi:ATP-binding cassette subfamily F protein 3
MIDVLDISKQYGSKVLFEHASGRIGYRSRMALVGPNGAGKSTLIKMILGFEDSDSGRVARAKNISIGHLAQELPPAQEGTVLECVMRLDGRREALLLERSELERAMSTGEHAAHDTNEALERYGRVVEEIESLDEYRLESRALTILNGMGFAIDEVHRRLDSFSGGWRMRAALSRLLLMDPDLLLLDEPTNHLDLESLLWLEQFLRSYQGALMLVSHDTEFLNRVVSEVLEIDQRKLWTYKGNIDSYLQQKEERLAVLRAQFEGQQARIAEIEDFVRRFGAKASKARQAQSRLKELERMERIEMPDSHANVRFRFPPAPHSGKEVVTVKNGSFSYPSKPVYEDLNWVIARGSRVAIVGVNGAGKSTLLRILAGQLKLSAGEFKYGHELRVGYYAQHQAESLTLDKTILQELTESAPDMNMAQIRAIAGAFLFSGDTVQKKCRVLSGGEKARVALAKLLLTPANFLLLDEPTNHLDVESRGVLLEALQDYSGTLCLVSHDRAFVGPLVDSVLEVQPRGPGRASRVESLLGGYADYVARASEAISMKASASLAKAGTSAAGAAHGGAAKAATKLAPSNNQRRAWERECEKLESQIEKLEREQSELQAQLVEPALYNDKPRLKAHMDRQTEVEKLLGEKMARWEELSALLGSSVSGS